MAEQLTYPEYQDWQLFYKANPFGEIREESRNALLCCLLVSLHSKSKPNFKDYLLYQDTQKENNWKVSKANMMAFVTRN